MIDKPLGGSIQSVRIREKELALMCEILYKHSTQRISVGGPGFAEGMSSSQLKSATSGHFTMGPQAGLARVQAIDLLTNPCPAEVEPPTIIISAIPQSTKDGPVLPDCTLHHIWTSSSTGGVAVDVWKHPSFITCLHFVRTDGFP
ncbi:unnamed protein product [Penicillium salamii]|nr:unnamed protein product [Penicillium salamii]CAG8168430.1 unnamed protein product [Penicillium salamii]CAG8247820.1 unnamed protein product [Penicillium salamii]